jgi:hypothetical protein
LESYQHEFAKRVLAQWLRHEARQDDYHDFGPFRWRPNRGEPHYGVWLEYPVSESGGEIGYGAVWDESGWSEQLYGESETQETRPPTYAECLKLGRTPSVIFDIAIQHKGAITYGIEIVHKNGLNERKLRKLEALYKAQPNFRVYAADAVWIMHQIGVPRQPDLGFELVCGWTW